MASHLIYYYYYGGRSRLSFSDSFGSLGRRNALPEDTNDGVLITNMHTYNVDQTTSSQLLAGDVLTSIDGIPVASNGDVTLDNAQPSAALGQINQTKLDVLFSMRRHGDKLKLRVLRKEKVYDDEVYASAVLCFFPPFFGLPDIHRTPWSFHCRHHRFHGVF